ncbi:MAG: LLM class F420-dependent oxidoreductase [Acidimicrobiia bacterium]
MAARYGITVPFSSVPLNEHKDWYEECASLGYTDLWTGEAQGADGFTPLTLAAAWAPSLRLGTAIIPAFTRAPAVMAQSVAAMAEAAPGRFAFGIGTSSNVIVEQWNGVPFEEPYKRTRDMVRFVKAALSGEKITEDYDTFSVKGFRLGMKVRQVPPVLVAALRPGMLRMAAREGEGAIINWLSADDVKTVKAEIDAGWGDKVGEPEVVARIFVCPSEDVETVRNVGRFMIAAYVNVPVYAEFHRWLGRGDQFQGMWDAWQAGDRKAATAAIPDEVVDELIVHGSPDECRAKIQRYVDNGVTTPVLAVVAAGMDERQAIRDLAPR